MVIPGIKLKLLQPIWSKRSFRSTGASRQKENFYCASRNFLPSGRMYTVSQDKDNIF